MRKIAIAAVAALWATGAGAAQVHFDNSLGLGLGGTGSSTGISVFSGFSAVGNARSRMMLGVLSQTNGGGLSPFLGRPVVQSRPLPNTVVNGPSAVPAPGGLVLLLSGLAVAGAGMGLRRLRAA